MGDRSAAPVASELNSTAKHARIAAVGFVVNTAFPPVRVEQLQRRFARRSVTLRPAAAVCWQFIHQFLVMLQRRFSDAAG
jgi:hypothetical protein